MSHTAEGSTGATIADAELAPSTTKGYQVGQARAMSAYAELDKDDEALNRWKASLGVNAAGGALAGATKPKVTVFALSLNSTGLSEALTIDTLDGSKLNKDNPIIIKEGSEYSVEIRFLVNDSIVSGLKYIQVVKRKGIQVDKMEQMIGSYGPSQVQVSKRFATEEAPSGMLARGSYLVRSRVIDDDGTIHADFSWSFKIAKEW